MTSSYAARPILPNIALKSGTSDFLGKSFMLIDDSCLLLFVIWARISVLSSLSWKLNKTNKSV
jgi:hypothetical protein